MDVPCADTFWLGFVQNHQIEQLKEEISAKDLALVKEHFDHMKVEKEREALRFEITKAEQQIHEADAAVFSQKAELEKLNQIINEADQVCSMGPLGGGRGGGVGGGGSLVGQPVGGLYTEVSQW